MYYIVIIQIVNLLILNVMISFNHDFFWFSVYRFWIVSDSNSSEFASTENDFNCETTDSDSYSLILIPLIGLTFTRVYLDLPMVTWSYCAEMEIVVIS